MGSKFRKLTGRGANGIFFLATVIGARETIFVVTKLGRLVGLDAGALG